MLPRRFQRLQGVLRQRQPDLTVLMEDVHKPHNLSAIVRTCDSVGICEVHSVHSFEALPMFNQIAKGSQKWVKICPYDDVRVAIAGLRQQGLNIYAAHLSDEAVDYRTVDYTQPTAILLGAERWGVTETAADLVDGHIIIPMLGMVQSLNVSVAAAVILFEAQRQRLAAGLYDVCRLEGDRYEETLFEWAYPELAAIYQEKNIPYPDLDEEGNIIKPR